MQSIYIDANAGNMAWLQYVIEQGRHGIHVLFEPEEIRRAFERDTNELSELEPGKVKRVNRTINEIIRATDAETQRNLILGLDEDLRDLLVLLYFQMIDRNLSEEGITKH